MQKQFLEVLLTRCSLFNKIMWSTSEELAMFVLKVAIGYSIRMEEQKNSEGQIRTGYGSIEEALGINVSKSTQPPDPNCKGPSRARSVGLLHFGTSVGLGLCGKLESH